MTQTKRCPWCAEEIRAEAVKCRYCGSFVEPRALQSLAAPWARPQHGRMLAGVCAGLAEQFAISVTVLRIAFVLGFFFSAGVVLLLYIALWVAMPSGESPSDLDPSPRG